MSEFKIEKGVPLLPKGSGRGPSPTKGTGFKALLNSMEVGDSVFRPGWNARRASGAVATATKDGGFKFAQRKVEGGIRIWRIE